MTHALCILNNSTNFVCLKYWEYNQLHSWINSEKSEEWYMSLLMIF